MRYIDADELTKRIYPLGIGDGMYVINAKAVKFAIDNTPTADVVPKSDVEELKKAYLRYKETTGLKQAKAEVAREIFEEIEKIDEDTVSFQEFYWRIMKLKNKYLATDNESEVNNG